MKHKSLIILSVILSMSASSCSDYYEKLDYAIEHSDEYDAAYRHRQDSLYNIFIKAADDKARFKAAFTLQKNYFYHSADSCYRYARIMEETSGESPENIALSRTCLSRILLRMNLPDKAEELIGSVNPDNLCDDDKHLYYITRITLLKKADLPDSASIENLLEEWRRADSRHADCFYICKQDDGKNGLDRYSYSALESIVSHPISRNEYAKANYGLGMMNLEIGDTDKAIKYLAESAKTDMELSVKGYGSLYELARILMRRGDVKRAVNYIRRTRSDAQYYNYTSRFKTINEMEVETLGMLLMQEMRQKRILFITLPVIIALLLITFIILMKLRQSQAKLMEVSSIKDDFLTTYMERCVDYLNKVDEYKSDLRHTAKQDGPEAVLAILRKPSFADSEFHKLLEEFDTTFLGIFPDFIEKVNSMTKAEFKYALNEDGSMTTNLRILALIRLGINERKKIAKILNMSLGTVYVYHTRLVQHSTCSQEDFDSVVKKL